MTPALYAEGVKDSATVNFLFINQVGLEKGGPFIYKYAIIYVISKYIS